MKTIELHTLREIGKMYQDRFPKKKNPQIYFFQRGNRIFAYSPIFNYAAYLTKEEYEFLTNHELLEKNDIHYDSLINSFLYLPESENVFVPIENIGNRQKLDEKKLNINTLSLIITPLCNLRCKYCFIFGGEKDKILDTRQISRIYNQLDVEAMKDIIDQLKPKVIHFFGWGEPTISFDAIKEIVDTYGKKMKYSIVTNGVYYSRRSEIVKYMMENNFDIELSFDGLPRINDLYRVMPDGSSSTQEILATLQEFKKYKGYSDKVSISIIVCGGNEDLILESVRYIESLGFKNIFFEPLEMNGRAMENNIKPVDAVKMAINLAEATIYAKKHGLFVFSKFLPASRNLINVPFGCSFVEGRSIALGPDYNLYLCLDSMLELMIGSVEKVGEEYKIKINYDKLNYIIEKRYAPNLENCDDCPVKCGGGCTKCSINNYKNLNYGGESEEYCRARREALARYIELAFV
ncbi:MAG: radical SAM protein [Candidatus Nanoarchaeia archaeon]|jgi:radical SAM protein with 4Fe4S-binding SPASM domain